MTRKVLWAVLVIGVALIVAPLAMSLPGRSSAGQRMIDDFHPIMQADSVKTTYDYYYDVFVPLRAVVPAVSKENVATFEGYLAGIKGMQADAAKLVPALAQQLGMTEQQVQQFFGGQFPAMAQMLAGLPQMEKDFGGLLGVMGANVEIFERVPPGLDHYKPLVETMNANIDNYAKINALPNFKLFTWFFIVPGILLVLLSGAGLAQSRRAA